MTLYTLQNEKDFQSKKVVQKAFDAGDIDAPTKATYDAAIAAYTTIGGARANFASVIAPGCGNGWTDAQGPAIKYCFTVSSVSGTFEVDDAVDNDGWEGVITEIIDATHFVAQATYPCTTSVPSTGQSVSVTDGASGTVDEVTCEF
jgi:hypothetical protein